MKEYNAKIENGFYMVWITELALKRTYTEEPGNAEAIRIIETKLDAYHALVDIMGLTEEFDEYKAERDFRAIS